MSTKSNAEQARSFPSKASLACGLWFVAIVWSIAGAFLGLEFAWSEFLSQSIRLGWLPAELAMPTRERMVVEVCRPEDADKAEAATVVIEDAAAMQQMRYATWMLGQQFGFAAAMANMGYTDAQTAPLREELQNWAAMLRLPIPTAPKSQHVLHQLNDFGDYLEADPQCIAARLMHRYGSRYGDLYKFGAVVGYGVPVRAQGIGVPFALQIQLYGRNAGIPQELWLPLTQDFVDLPGTDPLDKTIALVERLGQHIANNP